VEYYLRESGYEIYPYGYENFYVNITRGVSSADSDTTTTMLRRMPDLLVYDRDQKKSYLVEVKTRDRLNYWIKQNDLDTYKEYWSEAILVIYCVQNQEVYCRQIAEIDPKSLTTTDVPKGWAPSYRLDLKDFKTLSECFPRVKPEEYSTLRDHAIDVLKKLSLHCDKQDPYQNSPRYQSRMSCPQ
jgi:hypothetical protein